MRKLKVCAPAKLNLNLHIFPKEKEPSYHKIQAVNCLLRLHDTLFIGGQIGKIEVLVGKDWFLDQEKNLSYQAALLLKQKFGKPDFGARIYIKKEIPIKAGLGGGSSDAAATLNGLLKLWGLELTEKKMLNLARKLGMDVCYSLIGGLACVSGFGERVKIIKLAMPKIPVLIVLAKEEKPSTKWAYQNLDEENIGHHQDKVNRLIDAIKEKNIKKISQFLHNDFEISMARKFPTIRKIRKDLLKNGALKAILAGSGLSMAGLFFDKEQALKAQVGLSKKYQDIILTETL